MKRSDRSWWLIYGACVLGALSVLVWITLLVLELERGELEARARNAHQRSTRDALLRMDSWFSVHLAREARRPYFEYRPFYPQEQSYTRLLNRIEPGEVLIPSPLLDREFELIRLHFQIESDGTFTSPTAPSGNQRDLVEANAVSIDAFERSRAKLAALADSVTAGDVRRALTAAEAELARLLEEAPGGATAAAPARGGSDPDEEAREEGRAQRRAQSQDLNTRAKWTVEEQVAYPPAGTQWAAPALTVEVGPLVPIWIGARTAPELCYVRRVRTAAGAVVQGFVCDWPRLSDSLRRQVEGIVAGASLVPARDAGEAGEERGRLATIPAYLATPPPAAPAARGFTPARGTLAVSWFAALLAVAAVGVTLRASIAYGEKRSRFASAVTHELRSPLTTFRMYAEMLSKGMVQGEDRRREYLRTLQEEADRLTHLVENVLTYARLEEGRQEPRRERVACADLVERLLPRLLPRCEEGGLELAVDVERAAGALLDTDVDAVGQILFNLVDNACKYARGGDDARLHLDADAGGERVAIRVRDHGDGVPDTRRRAIFSAFDRGDRDPADAEPGVGLGLALARGLARDLGGDLALERHAERGACFRLDLPLAR